MEDIKFTAIYYDAFINNNGEQELLPYVRLCPNFMNTEDTCFWHGISLHSGLPFNTEKEALEFAGYVEDFFKVMIRDLENKGE